MRRALSAVLVVLMVIGLFPPRVGARGLEERGESKRLHFHLDQDGFLDPDEEHHLHVAGRRHALHRHTHATLEPFRADSPGSPHEPSHYVDVRLPSDRVVMLYVTQRSDRGGSVASAHGTHVDHGLSLPIIHIPNHARRPAIKAAAVRARVKSNAAADAAAGGGCASDLNGDGAVTEAELSSFTPCDVARTLLYHHPQMLNFDANKGATVMTHIENAPGLDQLAIKIKSLGPHGWYTMQPVQNADGSQFTRTDTGKPVFSYVVKDDVRQAAATALQNALIGVTNEPTLAGASYNVVDGTTAVVQGGPSPLTAVADVRQSTGGTSFTLSNLGPQPGVSMAVAGVNGQDVTIRFTNFYVRHLAFYVQFYDDGDKLVVPSGWSSKLGFLGDSDVTRLDSDTTKFISLINPVPTIMGIPVGSLGSDNFTFTMPSNATYAKLLAGGLGLGGDRNAMVEEMGVALTVMFELGIPTFLLMSTATSSDLGEALRGIYRDTAIVSGVVKAFFSLIWSNSDPDLKTLVSRAAVLVANVIVQGVFQKLVTLLAQIMAQTLVLDALPFAGWIVNAVNIASTVALLAQTTVEVSTSPWVYETKLQATHDIDVVIRHDPNNFQFPATATQYEVRARFADSDVRKSGPVDLPGTTVSAPITYTFTGVPSGNTVDITVGFYSATGWLAGRAELNGVTNLTPSGQTAQQIDITIQEQLVPLDGTSVYAHKQKLVVAGGVHRWQAAAAPTATLADLDVGVTGSGVSELGNISLSQTVGAAGYVWRSLSPGVTNCLSGGTPSQLYTYQNVSLTQNPETGLKFSGCGFSVKPYVLLDLLGAADGTGHNFVIEPATDGNWYVRRFVLDGSETFDVAAGQSYGRLPMAVDSAVLHPKGYILGINRSTSKLFQLKLAPTAVNDANAPDALLFAGPATSLASAEANPNLLINPRAVALGSDGQVIVLEDISTLPAGTAPAGARGRLRAFSEFGNPIKYFGAPNTGGQYGALLTAEPTPVTYLDMGIENRGYIYVLSYANDGHLATDYRMDIYNPDGTFLVRTTGVAAARLAVDLWRNVNTLNFETLTGPGGRLEPSISEWIPPTPPASDSKVRRTR
jgi:hypothetical protein